MTDLDFDRELAVCEAAKRKELYVSDAASDKEATAFLESTVHGYPEALRRLKRLRELCSAVFVRPGERVTATAKAATEIRRLLNIKET